MTGLDTSSARENEMRIMSHFDCTRLLSDYIVKLTRLPNNNRLKLKSGDTAPRRRTEPMVTAIYVLAARTSRARDWL